MLINFNNIHKGSAYTRPQLAKLWGYKSYEAISRGIATPAGKPYIILFITKEKQLFLPQYEDFFSDGILTIQGEPSHFTDKRIA
jgi:putative restriction endonuclease